MKPPRRTIFKVLLLLAAGATLNVAVAWGIASWMPKPVTPAMMVSHPGRLTWIVSSSNGVGITRVSLVPKNRNWGVAELGHVDIPRWSLASEPPTESVFTDLTGQWNMEFGYGWPLRSTYALVRRHIFDTAGEPTPQRFGVVSGIAVLDDGSSNPMPFRVLPLTPIWPGFAINTVFYAGLLWMLFCGPFALRRMIRSRRGQCAHCAYPIGQNERCTECGAAVLPLSSKGRGPG